MGQQAAIYFLQSPFTALYTGRGGNRMKYGEAPATKTVTSGGIDQAPSQFNIQNSPIAFRTLSSGLYTDPVRAVIRELACNAYDAHVVVGKEKEPFKTNLPTNFEPSFRIRDFGPGMLRFLDNLMLNPVQSTIQELYDFLKKYNLPITDRGTFCAYKRVKDDYTDCHTGTVDNHIGQIPVMPFFEVDQDRTNLCSRGYHFCSRAYLSGFHGGHLMVIEINPAEVVEIPPSNCVEGKGRSWRYEVIAEIANEDYTKEDAAYLQRTVAPVEKDRRTRLTKLLVLPTLKRLTARTERARNPRNRNSCNVHLMVEKAGLTREALGKASLGRLQHWYERFAPIDPSVKVPAESPLFKNPTRPARLTSGVSIVDLAARMKMKASDVYRIEKAESPNQESIDKYLAALIAIKNVGGVTYKTAAATA